MEISHSGENLKEPSGLRVTRHQKGKRGLHDVMSESIAEISAGTSNRCLDDVGQCLLENVSISSRPNINIFVIQRGTIVFLLLLKPTLY